MDTTKIEDPKIKCTCKPTGKLHQGTSVIVKLNPTCPIHSTTR